MDYKKSYTLLWVGLIAGFVLMLIGVFLEIGWLLWPGAVVVMADVLQTLLFFRCPYCGGHWDRSPAGGVHSRTPPQNTRTMLKVRPPLARSLRS